MNALKVLTFLFMIVCTTTGCVTEDEPKGADLGIGDKLPEFTVTLNTGKTVSTSSLIGKKSVIVFFNTNCSDCRAELPVIQELWNLYEEDSDVEILLIAREENLQEIAEYWESNGFTMAFSPQENRSVYNLFATSVIPRIYISNPDGVIIASTGDTDMPTLEDLRNFLSNQ